MRVLNSRSRLAKGMSVMLLLGIAGCAGQTELPLLPAEGGGETAADGAPLTDSGRLVRMGQRSLAAGDPTTAVGFLEQALAVDRDNREAAVLLGNANLGLGRPQDAAAAFGLVLQDDPADREAAIGYAKAMIAIGRSETAEAHLEPLVRQRPGDVEASNLLGVALDLQGAHDQAIAVYHGSLDLSPGEPALMNNLGLSLALAGRHDEAIAVLRPLAEGYASSARTRQNLALAYGLRGEMAAAERWSRMDLADSDVTNNLRYFRTIAGLEPGAVRSAALQPDFKEPVVREAPGEPRLAAPRPAAPVVPAPPSPATSAPAASAPAASAAPKPLVTGPAHPQAPAAAGPAPLVEEPKSEPAAAGPGFGMVEPSVGLVGVEATALGRWFVDLGSFDTATATSAYWRTLRRTHAAATAGLGRLAGGSTEAVPLIVGPFATAAEADALCAELTGAVVYCNPVQL
jgi:Flp pilus assembly protein TadD